MRRLLALAALVVSVVPAALAAPAKDPTWRLRWPATGEKAVYVLTVRQADRTIKHVHVFVKGIEVDDLADYIVACAHRGPSFAQASWAVPKAYTIRVRVTLESGPCAGGPKTAGTPAAVRVHVDYE